MRCRKTQIYLLKTQRKNSPTVGFLLPRLKPNFKKERKICRRLFMSSFKREIRKLHMVVHVQKTAKEKCTKKCDAGAKLLFYLQIY